MKRKFTTLLFGLLLAVGWISSAQAQALPSEKISKGFVKVVDNGQLPFGAPMDCYGVHSHASALPFKPVIPTANTQKTATSSKHAAPLHAGVKRDFKSISWDDAYAITYTWNYNGHDSVSHATDVARYPEQMYELLRKVYMTPAFPGPYYSAYTKTDERERKVYYGAINGGWGITGDALPSETETFNDSKTVCSETTTNSYIPAAGNYQDYGYRSQVIYPSSLLSGLSNGDKINSITFYPSAGIKFSGSTVTFQLCNTTESNFGTSSNTSTSRKSFSGAVSATVTPTANTSATEWTITFDSPLTYTGGNLLLDVYCVGYSHGGSGSYSTSPWYGANQDAYQSMYTLGSSDNTPAETKTGSNSQFVPKTKFDYERTIDPNSLTTIGDIRIKASGYNVLFRSITVYDENNNVLTSWSSNDSYYTYTSESTGTTYQIYYLPTGWNSQYSLFRWSTTYNNTTYNYGYLGGENEPGTITIPKYLLDGHSSVRVVVLATNDDDNQTITVNEGTAKSIDAGTYAGTSYEWTLNAQTYSHTDYDPDYYLPDEEGYTALIVAVKNSATQVDWNNYEDDYENGYHDTKQKIIDYLTANVDSIQLLTDGLRIGEGSDYSCGTLFNCDGTYNKFFFLSKGQARQKPDVVLEREVFRQHLIGEYVPFRFMFEQFSPTSTASESETENFYSKMNEGNVYNVVHDCRSVIYLGHQFSMSGNAGTQAYAMTGMNFFIPDYRLKYWEYQYGSITTDGRIINPYQSVSDDGNPVFDPSLVFNYPSNIAAWYAQYNQDYAPKVGLYKITLEAVAEPVANVQEEGNRNYKVTLTWVSSLNEMTGHDVPQIYTVYYYDPITGEKKYLVVEGYTTVDGETGMTTLVYYVEQFEHSYIIDYVVTGRPEDSEHEQFVAESNHDNVVIPGWNDFVGLQLDHHESDFEADDMANWYRNFLVVVNEDQYNGLTVSKISGYNEEDPTTPNNPMKSFNLYRWAIKDGVAQGEEKVATLVFDQVSADQVHYHIYYKDEDHADLTDQQILEDSETPGKYQRITMGIPDEGWIRVKGNGDLVIWPNGYFVNFKSIVIKNGDNVLYSWYASNADIDEGDAKLLEGWETSPGSMMVPYIVTTTGEKVCYMEGGGYIYIPNMVNTYDNLTVEIVAYTDGSHVGRIEVNDKSQSLTNAAATYTWSSNDEDHPISPSAAPRRDNNGNTTNNN